MVSHDYESSIVYADRRITLENGKIAKDEIRREGYFNEFRIIDRTAYVPYLKQMNDVDLECLKEQTKLGCIDKIIQIGEGFMPCENLSEADLNYFEAKPVSLNKEGGNSLSKNISFLLQRHLVSR